jgi:hypothetical protein
VEIKAEFGLDHGKVNPGHVSYCRYHFRRCTVLRESPVNLLEEDAAALFQPEGRQVHEISMVLSLLVAKQSTV